MNKPWEIDIIIARVYVVSIVIFMIGIFLALYFTFTERFHPYGMAIGFLLLVGFSYAAYYATLLQRSYSEKWVSKC